MGESARRVFEFGRWQTPTDGFWWTAAALLVALFVLAVYRRELRRLPRGVAVVAAAARLGAWALAFWVLLDPRERWDVVVDRPSRVAVLADVSLSMTVDDASGASAPVTRAAKLAAALADPRFLTELRRTHEVAVYGYGRTVEPIAVLPKLSATEGVVDAPIDWADRLKPSQDQSRLGEALAELLRREATPTLSGVVVATDGQNNVGVDVAAAVETAARGAVPLGVLALGDADAAVNVRLADLQAPARVFRGDELKATALVQVVGAPNAVVPLELIVEQRDDPSSGVVIDKREVKPESDGRPLAVEFRWTPTAPGDWRLRLRAPAAIGEKQTADNIAVAPFEVVERRTKILLAAGGPNRDFQFLRALLRRDPTMETSVLLQSAGAEPTVDSGDARRAFPEDQKDLFSFDVVVAMDFDWTTLSAAGRTLLSDWVGRQGGGLLFAAGPI
ncbi:MAG: hypothetical protein ACRC1K_19970, partial [Planctomycetia bacterium]